jgi:hypothetical protein
MEQVMGVISLGIRAICQANFKAASSFHGILVESCTPLGVRKDLPNRNTGRATLMLVHFSRREPVPVRTSQIWLRWFNSAFVSRLGCKHCSDAAVS